MWPGARINPSEPAIIDAANTAVAAAKAAKIEAAKAAAAQQEPTAAAVAQKKARKPLSKFTFEVGSAQWAASR